VLVVIYRSDPYHATFQPITVAGTDVDHRASWG